MLERDVRYLDSRIALLIQNVSVVSTISPPAAEPVSTAQRMALDEREEVQEHLQDVDDSQDSNLDDRRMQVSRRKTRCDSELISAHSQQYANLFFLLQSEPRHIASLCRLVSLGEIDTLLQTVMFTLYGNQYESREEHLLLTMFQVRRRGFMVCTRS